VAQSVERLSAFGSGHGLRVLGSGSVSGSLLSGDSVFPFPQPLPPAPFGSVASVYHAFP